MSHTKKKMKRDMLLLWGTTAKMYEPDKFGARKIIKKKSKMHFFPACPTCKYDETLNCMCECPFPWNGKSIESECSDDDSYYAKFNKAPGPRSKRMYALEIYKISLRLKV